MSRRINLYRVHNKCTCPFCHLKMVAVFGKFDKLVGRYGPPCKHFDYVIKGKHLFRSGFRTGYKFVFSNIIEYESADDLIA